MGILSRVPCLEVLCRLHARKTGGLEFPLPVRRRPFAILLCVPCKAQRTQVSTRSGTGEPWPLGCDEDYLDAQRQRVSHGSFRRTIIRVKKKSRRAKGRRNAPRLNSFREVAQSSMQKPPVMQRRKREHSIGPLCADSPGRSAKSATTSHSWRQKRPVLGAWRRRTPWTRTAVQRIFTSKPSMVASPRVTSTKHRTRWSLRTS